jgi:hypothetical protein
MILPDAQFWLSHARVFPGDGLKPVACHMAIGNALLPTAADPFHGDSQPLCQEPKRDAMAAHQATQRWATEIEHAGFSVRGGALYMPHGRMRLAKKGVSADVDGARCCYLSV